MNRLLDNILLEAQKLARPITVNFGERLGGSLKMNPLFPLSSTSTSSFQMPPHFTTLFSTRPILFLSTLLSYLSPSPPTTLPSYPLPVSLHLSIRFSVYLHFPIPVQFPFPQFPIQFLHFLLFLNLSLFHIFYLYHLLFLHLTTHLLLQCVIL